MSFALELLNLIQEMAYWPLVNHYMNAEPPHSPVEAQNIANHLVAKLDATAIGRGLYAARECRVDDDGVLHRSPVQRIFLKIAKEAYLPYAVTHSDIRGTAFAREVADGIHWSHERQAVAEAKRGVPAPRGVVTEEHHAAEMERRYEQDRKGRRPLKPLYRV
jgi:hypothetical protein